MQKYQENWLLFDDVLPILTKLLDYRIGIITNGNSIQQREKLHKLNIANFFETVIISEEIGFGKPDRRIFEEACKRIALPPQKCIYIGDKLQDDAIASYNANLVGVWLNRKEKIEQNINNVQIFYGLQDLLSYLAVNNP